MEFECRESIDIDLTKNPANSINKPCKEEAESIQANSSATKKCLTVDSRSEIRKSDEPKPLLEIHSQRGNLESCDENSLPVGDVLPVYRRSIIDLPPALVSEILNCLDPKELGMVSCVSTLLYRLASDHHVWKEFYCERWGWPMASGTLGSGYPDEKTWKELFVDREFQSKAFMGRYSIDVLYGHTEAVRTVFFLSAKKILFTSGYDQIVRMWDAEEGLSIASSRPLGCTIRAVTADTKLLVVGGTDGFIHGWRAEEGHPHLFDFRSPQNQTTEFRLWEHHGPITCLALDSTKIYSGSWDMTIHVWDRSSFKCLNVLMHNDWVWSLVPHGNTVASTSGSDIYLWDSNMGTRIAVINDVHVGNANSIARSHAGNLLFTGGDDGAIHMFEISKHFMGHVRQVATWMPHSDPVYSLAFEFPWLVSSSSDGRLSLIDVRKLLRKNGYSSVAKPLRMNHGDHNNVEPPQRMLHGFGCNLFSVAIGADRIVCGGVEGVVRIWNFSQALEIERRVHALRSRQLVNKMRRLKLQIEMTSKVGQTDQCSVAAKKNPMNGDRNAWRNKRQVSGKAKA